MIKIVAILLFVWLDDGQPTVKLEQIPVKTIVECVEKGEARIAEHAKDPNFVWGLYADCIELPAKIEL